MKLFGGLKEAFACSPLLHSTSALKLYENMKHVFLYMFSSKKFVIPAETVIAAANSAAVAQPLNTGANRSGRLVQLFSPIYNTLQKCTPPAFGARRSLQRECARGGAECSRD